MVKGFTSKTGYVATKYGINPESASTFINSWPIIPPRIAPTTTNRKHIPELRPLNFAKRTPPNHYHPYYSCPTPEFLPAKAKSKQKKLRNLIPQLSSAD
jgi:hypothetical protein